MNQSKLSELITVGLLGMVVVITGLCGTASASPTSVAAESDEVSVTGSSPQPMSFPLERTGDLSYDAWVQYETQNGTAVAGADYEGTSGSLLIPAGESEASIPVQALGASAYSPDKQFALHFGAVGIGPTPTFAVPQSFPTGSNANSIAPADVNGDGRRDLLVTNSLQDTFTVMLNETAPGAAVPSYAPGQTFPSGRGPRSALAADFNGDGRPDLALGNNQFDEAAVSVFLNTTALGSSTASFGPRQVVATGDNPQHLEAADLNGDGRLDLVVGNGVEDEVSVLMNTTEAGATTASFGPRLGFNAGLGTFTPQATDVNGDGRPDLVFIVNGSLGAEAVSVLLNTTPPGAPTPSFSAPSEFPLQGVSPRSVTVADFNGDGKPDLAVVGWGIPWLSVLLNTTATGATTPSFAPEYGVPGVSSGFREWVTSDDFNGDGKPDLGLVKQGNGEITVLANATPPGARTPNFSPPQDIGSPAFGIGRRVVSTDVNGDGKPDILTANGSSSDNKVSVLLNTTPPPTAGAPSFATEQSFATGDAPSAISQADVNGDGRADLLVANAEDDDASVLLNTTAPGATAPSFAAEQSFATGDAPSAISQADVNGDGRADLLVANAEDDDASVLLNTTAPGATAPSFAAEQSFATGDAPSAIDTADVNGDGGPDLISANRGSDDLSVLLDTQYAAAVTPASVTGTIHYAIPRVSLSPSPLPFGEQPVGSSTSKTVTLANTGGEELAIAGIAINGPNADQLGQANDCPDALPVGSSCSIVVTYTPSGPISAAAALTVTTDAPSSPDAVALSGTGHKPPPPPPPTRTLTVGLAGDGAGTVTTAAGGISCPPACSQPYLAGTRLQLTADPAPGSTFAGWSGGCAGAGTCQLTLAADTTLVARFEKAAPVPARLRIDRVRPRRAGSKVKVVVAGTIAKAALGVVKVTVGARLNGRRLSATARAPIRNGRWRARLPLAGLGAGRAVTIKVGAGFQGSPGVEGARAKRRAVWNPS